MTTDGKVITMQSSAEEKIRLFRAMFCGREGVYAERWESKTGKCGYQPVCRNEWIRDVIVLPLSTERGLPSNVSILRERKLDETYSESVKRILRTGLTSEEVDLFAFAAEQLAGLDKDAPGLVAEGDEDFPTTKGLFELNGKLDIPFGANPFAEEDLLSRTKKLAVEIDGYRHFQDKEAYRRDRRKDELLQSAGYFVLRFLAEDVMSDLGTVVNCIKRHLI